MQPTSISSVRVVTITGLALAIFAATAIACQAGGISDKEIVVGTHLDLSGPVSAAMPQLRNGMQMRFDEANEAGGVNGRKISSDR